MNGIRKHLIQRGSGTLKIRILTIVCLMVFVTSVAVLAASPSIKFTHVPKKGTWSENLRGKVVGVNTAKYKVAVYICVDGGWWNKPTWAEPTCYISKAGYWSCDIVTGGTDEDAEEVAAFLIPKSYSPPACGGDSELPSELYAKCVAKVSITRH